MKDTEFERVRAENEKLQKELDAARAEAAKNTRIRKVPGTWKVKRETIDGEGEEVNIAVCDGYTEARVIAPFGHSQVVPMAQLLDLATGKKVAKVHESLIGMTAGGVDNGACLAFVTHLATIGFGGFVITPVTK